MSRHRNPDPKPETARVEAEARLLSHAVPGALGAELLARSPHAAVWRVVEPDLGSVVVKVLPAERLPQIEEVYRRLGVQGGVLSLQGSGSEAEDGFLLFPYYPQTLADRIDAGPLPAPEVGRLLRSAADSVVALHLAGLVHGDIKPANLLLAPSGQAVLGDLDSATDHGRTPERVTPGFCPPEQLMGAPLSFENDVYSFTATVLTALAGGTAWMADPAGWLAGPMAGALSPELVGLLAAGIARDPAERRVSPQQLITCLGPAAAAWPAEGNPAPAPEPVVPTRQVLSPRTIGPGEPAQPVPAPRTGTIVADEDELVRAAQQVWGFIDLRATTMDRLALQLQPPPSELEPEAVEPSIWRHPAMIASLVAGSVLVLLAVVLLIV